MTDEDLKQIEAIVRKNNSTGDAIFFCVLFTLFLNGCFSGCGYNKIPKPVEPADKIQLFTN
jgi:hypothetical protein